MIEEGKTSKNLLPEKMPDRWLFGMVNKKNKTIYVCMILNDSCLKCNGIGFFNPASQTL